MSRLPETRISFSYCTRLLYFGTISDCVLIHRASYEVAFVTSPQPTGVDWDTRGELGHRLNIFFCSNVFNPCPILPWMWRSFPEAGIYFLSPKLQATFGCAIISKKGSTGYSFSIATNFTGFFATTWDWGRLSWPRFFWPNLI